MEQGWSCFTICSIDPYHQFSARILNFYSHFTYSQLIRDLILVGAEHALLPIIHGWHKVVAGWATGYDGILRTAQTLIVPSAPKENANGLVDLSIALTYLELAALPFGVGTCWAGLLRAAMLATPEFVVTV